MKIAVSSKGAGLGAWIHPDFLTCNFIVVVDEPSLVGTPYFLGPDDLVGSYLDP